MATSPISADLAAFPLPGVRLHRLELAASCSARHEDDDARLGTHAHHASDPVPAEEDGLVRRGFSMIELLISVLVLSVGLLALTGASAVILRQLTGGAQLSVAAMVAQGRLERLRGEDCQLITGGTSNGRGITETWSVSRADGQVEVVDTVILHARSGSRSWTFRSIIACPEPVP